MIIKRLVLIFAALLAFCLVILLSLWVNLKSESLTPWLEYQLNKQIPKMYTAEIGLAETHLDGLKLEQIAVYETLSRQLLLDIDSLEITANPIFLLIFQELDYEFQLYDGSIKGKLDLFPKKSITYKISNIQLNRNTFIRRANLILNNPILDGEGTYQISEKSEGKLTLGISKISISGKPDHTGLPYEFPTTDFDWIKGGFSLNDSDIEVQISSLGDLSVNIEGSVSPNWKTFNRSRLNLSLKGKMKPEYESGLGFFKDILVNYKDNAGQISIKITGNVNWPKIVRN